MKKEKEEENDNNQRLKEVFLRGSPKTKYGRNWVKILTKNISWKVFAPGS